MPLKKETEPNKNSTRYWEKLKIEKAAELDVILQKYGRPDNSTIYCAETVMTYIIKTL